MLEVLSTFNIATGIMAVIPGFLFIKSVVLLKSTMLDTKRSIREMNQKKIIIKCDPELAGEIYSMMTSPIMIGTGERMRYIHFDEKDVTYVK